jgi:hypothetical protein
VDFADNRAKEAFEHAVVGKGSSSLSIALWPNATPSHWLIHDSAFCSPISSFNAQVLNSASIG